MLRRSPRALVLWCGALAVAVVTAVTVASDLASLHRRAEGLGPERTALVARRDLRVGDGVARGDLAVRRVHASQLPDNVLADFASATGRVVVVPVLRGAFVGSRNLAPRHRTGLDGILPEGMRAFRVDVTGPPRPRIGAAVDVLASYDSASGDGPSGTEVIAAGALVLGTDEGGAGGTGRANALGVTLLVDRGEARALADAQAHGVLTLAVVPPEEAARPVPGLDR